MKKILLFSLLSLISSAALSEDLRLLVLYSDEVRTLYGSEAAVKRRISSLVNYANDTFENSDININLVTVATGEVAVSGDTNTNSKTLKNVMYSKSVNKSRKKHRPDLTVYLTSAGEYCGVAYLPIPSMRHSSLGRTSGFRPVSMSERARKGISIVRHNCTSSFAHEIGHNLGAGHGKVGEKVVRYPRGRFGLGREITVDKVSKGYPIKSSQGYGVVNVFRTVMAYNDFYHAARVQYFSNPSVRECGSSLACGAKGQNSASGMSRVFKDSVRHYSESY